MYSSGLVAVRTWRLLKLSQIFLESVSQAKVTVVPSSELNLNFSTDSYLVIRLDKSKASLAPGSRFPLAQGAGKASKEPRDQADLMCMRPMKFYVRFHLQIHSFERS